MLADAALCMISDTPVTAVYPLLFLLQHAGCFSWLGAALQLPVQPDGHGSWKVQDSRLHQDRPALPRELHKLWLLCPAGVSCRCLTALTAVHASYTTTELLLPAQSPQLSQ